MCVFLIACVGKAGQTWERATQGSAGVTTPGSVQKMWMCCLWTWFSSGLRVGLNDLGGLFQS